MLAAWLSATTSSTGGDPTSALLTYGPLGIFAAMSVLFMRIVYTDLKGQRDAERAEVTRLNSLLQEQVVAALLTASSAVQSSTELLRDIQREQQQRRIHESG